MAVEPVDSERDGTDGGEDADVWRCKDCGAVQRDPEPPCESCWGTTFVSGEGSDGAAGPGPPLAGLSNTPASGADLTATRIEHVKSASARTTLLAAGCTAVVAAASYALPTPSVVAAVLYGAALLLGGFTLLALVVSTLAHLVDAFGLVTGS
ncbi:hypothetical protein [Halobacterium jilantaiense]|uniref:Uncharacterized protein n=1 Tax=Halobacterium jilantaiense TaxID=355548 RepID=A0A1I0NG72_9EURY|nr:hypothetical protein [Halobacterium jilantaiense]SEV99761.1 hypothetical protein SAMN04487945_0815 [Halobacterium jilantaiense]